MIERTIYSLIKHSIKNRPVTLITGARQVGKSTLCKVLAKNFGFNYVSLDNLRERQSAINDPEMFLELHKFPLIIDEVQYAPQLFDVIEEIVNKEKFEKDENYGMFVLIGSQTYKLIEGVSQSMSGRVSIIEMSPLSKSEIKGIDELPFHVELEKNAQRCSNNQISFDEVYENIVKGFYPELYDNLDIATEQFYSDYVESYIDRDVSQIIKLNDKLKFNNFMEILASLTGEELVYDTLAKAIGVSVLTIQSWISVLVAGNIIHLLQPYNENSILKRVVKRPKIYFSDTGLACYLSRLNNPQTLISSRFNGRFFETYVVNEIIKSYKNNGRKPNFYYYRDNDQKEIDLIILDGGKLSLIECKNGISFKREDFKAFDTLAKKTKYEIESKCVICNTQNIYSLGDDILVLPVSVI